MSTSDALVLVTQLFFIVLAALAWLQRIRRPANYHADVAVMLTSLAIPVVTAWLAAAGVTPTRWLEWAGAVALMAHPWLLLRILWRFRARQPWVLRSAAAGTLVSAVSMAAFDAPPPVGVSLLLVAYFVAAETYAGVQLVLGAVKATGLTRFRVRLAAVGSLLLAAIIAMAGVLVVRPDLEQALRVPIHGLGIGSAIAYYLGFMAPGPLRRSWQLRALHETFDQAGGMTNAGHQGTVSTAIRRVMGARLGLVATWSEQRTVLLHDGDTLVGTLAPTHPLGALLDSESTTFHGEIEDYGLVLAAQVQLGEGRHGAAIAVPYGGTLFPNEDVTLLALLCHRVSAQMVHEDRLLERADRRLSAIVTSSRDAISSVDPEGRIRSWNPAAEQLYGYAADEAIGTDIRSLLARDDGGALTALLARVCAGESVEIDHATWLHKGGETVDVALSISPIREDNHATGVSLISRDIGWKIRAQHELEASQSMFRDLFDHAPIGYLHVDAAGLVEDANDAAMVLLDCSPDEVVGRDLASLLGQREGCLVNASELSDVTEETVTIGTGTAQERRLHVYRSTLRVGGQIKRIRVALVDVTAQHEAEVRLTRTVDQLEQTNDELDQFAHVASHDLQAPLRAITQLARWIEEDLPPGSSDEVREHATLLRGRVERMRNLLRDLYRLARAGGEEPPEPVLLSSVIEELRATVSAPPEFHIEWPAEDLELVTSRTPLVQVLQNLLDNAIKHHHEGRGHVVLTAAVEEGHLLVSVSDDGPGIEPRFHDRVFGAFQTLRPRDEVEGSGMGLAIVRKMVLRAGGTIELTSRPGAGSTFEVRWPIVSATPPRASMAPVA